MKNPYEYTMPEITTFQMLGLLREALPFMYEMAFEQDNQKPTVFTKENLIKVRQKRLRDGYYEDAR